MMTKVLTSPVDATLSQGFSRFIDSIRKRGLAEKIVIVSTLPGGGLRVVRANFGSHSNHSQYAESLHESDSAAWNSILNGQTTVGSSPLAEKHNFVLGVGVDNLVLPGYRAAILLFCPPGHTRKNFDDRHEAQSVRELAAMHLGQKINGNPSKIASQIILSDDQSMILPEGQDSPFDESQIKQLFEFAGQNKLARGERIAIRSARGIATNVAITRFDDYRALGSGAKVFVSIYPSLENWQQISSEKVESDSEMARLVKAIHFITENFKTSPTLESIAESVGLSQFHFHRRFSEIFGVTPKHVLFDLQVEESKRQLAIVGKQLSEIASNCGFAHQSHFTCRFKQNTGITPTRWRVLNGVG